MEKQEKRQRLILHLPSSIYWKVKKASKLSYCTMTSYVIRAILDRFHKEAVTWEPEDDELYKKRKQVDD